VARSIPVARPSGALPVIRCLAIALLSVILVGMPTACTTVQEKVLDRSGCETCHQPLNDQGHAEGLEQAHPWQKLTCIHCHGGDPKTLDQAKAHVAAPKNDGSVLPVQKQLKAGQPIRYIRNLKAGDLDKLHAKRPDYLQFVNPGDLRVADKTCGGKDCHGVTVDHVKRSMMAHTSGEVTVARYRANAQKSPYGAYGAMPLVDPDFNPSLPTTVTSIGRFDPPPLGANPTYGDYQDHYMIKACFRCHTSDFGENKFDGDYRSSGCTSCHMVYADDGRSRSADPTISKLSRPHPRKHRLTNAIPTEQCTHCHYRGARIGPSYQGYRESAAAGHNPEDKEVLGIGLHGNGPSYYITHERDKDKYADDTPADIHFERGMHCIDCHTRHDSHGDGHIYSDTLNQIEIRCEDCHGSLDKDSTITTAGGRPLNHMWRDANGDVWLRGKIDGKKRLVKQIRQVIDKKSPYYNALADKHMGRDANGHSHLDTVECYTCHSDWMPNCYGCHVTLDIGKVAPALTTGKLTPGRPSGRRKWVEVHDLILMQGVRGKIAPAMPAERFFLTVKKTTTDAAGKKKVDYVFKDRPRMRVPGKVGAGGVPGMGARPVNPHTTRRFGRFSNCDYCHLKADKSNEEQVRRAWGYGSDKYVFVDGDGTKWRLDQMITDDHKSVVLSGHDDPHPAVPLSKATIDKMKKVVAP